MNLGEKILESLAKFWDGIEWSEWWFILMQSTGCATDPTFWDPWLRKKTNFGPFIQGFAFFYVPFWGNSGKWLIILHLLMATPVNCRKSLLTTGVWPHDGWGFWLGYRDVETPPSLRNRCTDGRTWHDHSVQSRWRSSKGDLVKDQKEVSNEKQKKSGCLGFIRDYATHL